MRTPARLSGSGSDAAPLLRNEGRDSVRCRRRVVSPCEPAEGPIDPDGPRMRPLPLPAAARPSSDSATGGPSGISAA